MKVTDPAKTWKEFDIKTKMLDKLWNKWFYQAVIKGEKE